MSAAQTTKPFKPLSILFSASEAAPFAKEGGLGDVIGALPKYLARMGHDVRIVLPRYYSVKPEKYGLRLLPGTLVVPMGIVGHQYCGVWEGRLPGSDVPVYFLEHEAYYGRSGLYQQSGEGYLDNDNRFVFLSKASLELCKMLDWSPDVIHAHDWHTGIIPVLLNSSYLHDRYVGNAASLLTLHNMQHQGNFYPGLMDVLGIGWKHFNYLELEMDDQVNLLKGGIYHANLLNTVSEEYSREIQTAAFGWGLEGVIRDRADDLSGILNGVDYEEWDPATDPFIAANYTARTVKKVRRPANAIFKRLWDFRSGTMCRCSGSFRGWLRRKVPISWQKRSTVYSRWIASLWWSATVNRGRISISAILPRCILKNLPVISATMKLWLTKLKPGRTFCHAVRL